MFLLTAAVTAHNGHRRIALLVYSIIVCSQVASVPLGSDVEVPSYRGDDNKTMDELEELRGLLSVHKQRLLASKWPAGMPAEAILSDNNAVVEEQSDDSMEQRHESDEESFFLMMKSPEILHLNRGLRDYLYQGDMALTAEQARHFLPADLGVSRVSRSRRQALNSANFGNFKWNGTVPYTFDASLDPSTKKLIREAMDFWESSTCVSFTEVPTSSRGEEANGQKSKLQIFKGDGCWSYVGKIYVWDSQEVSIGDGCEHFGVVTHELAHALGFFHAQSRHDRDKFVTFNAQNVQSGFEDQFGKESLDTNKNYAVTYDYGSVMHYSEVAFAREEAKPVLLATEPHNQNTMGQRMRPSFSDVLVMNRYYECLDKCPELTAAKCENGGYPAPRDCSKCVCPWGFGGPICADRQAATNGSAECGATVKAGTEWRELSAIVGEPTKVLRPGFDSCHWHIQAEETGKRVELKVLEAGRVCSAGCFYGNVEFKLGLDFGRTGLRMCCAKDFKEKPVLKSEGGLAVVSLYSRLFTQQFKVQYRQGNE